MSMSFGQYFLGVSYIGMARCIAGGSFIAGWLTISGIYLGIFVSCVLSRVIFTCSGAAMGSLGEGKKYVWS